MDVEEAEAIEQLLGTDSTLAQQKAGLKRLGEMLEESYILNLPPSSKPLKLWVSMHERPKRTRR